MAGRTPAVHILMS